MIEVLGVKNSQKIVPMKEDMQPVDPISENMFLLTGRPVKAFMYQDHDAHIQAHMAMKSDPQIMAIVGQNPQAQAIMAAGAAHLMEHIAFKYRADVQKKLGVDLPPPPDLDNDMGYLPPEIEVQISSVAAQAAQQLLQQNQAAAAQQQAQQQQQDPLIQMQQQELQIKQQQVQVAQQTAQNNAQIAQQEMQLKTQMQQLEMQLAQQEQQRKAKKDAADAAARADEIRLKEKELQLTHELGGAKLGIDMAHKKATHATQSANMADQTTLAQSKHELDAAKLGIDMAHKKATHKTDTQLGLMDHALKQKQAETQAKQAEQQAQQPQQDDSSDDN
jgi:hypothetical protein